MDPLNPFPAILTLLLAALTAHLLCKLIGAPPSEGRYGTIDGLRGYLALFVFLHHSCIWFFYLRTGSWTTPQSHLYAHFGQSGVAFFFMITGFLFFSKLLGGRTKPIDWLKLYVSRILRLTPLYGFAMILLFLIVGLLSSWQLQDSLPGLLISCFRWCVFSILGRPDINGIEHTATITAGVTWSLPYEWLFYCMLPVLGLMVRVSPPVPYLILGTGAIGWGILWQPQLVHLGSFMGGIIASYLVRSDAFRSFSSTRKASWIALVSIALAVGIYPSSHGIEPLTLLSIAFILIAGGCSLFGLLTKPFSRMLGEMAYSIYLLHGIMLFVAFRFVIGNPVAKSLSALDHWMFIFAITPLLILMCFVTFRKIERPAMLAVPRFSSWIRSRCQILSIERG